MRPSRMLVIVGAALWLGACSHPWGPGPGPGGPGPWAMGPGACGAGPGAGPMGPGAMGGGWGGPGGRGGAGMGPGMMGGAAPGWGMGPGMMGGAGPGGPGWGLAGLDLSADQRARIGEVQAELARRQWELMAGLHAQGGPMWGGGGAGGAPDDEQARRAYDAMAAVHKQVFELRLDARRRMLEVLTPAQREQLGRAGPGR